MVTPVGIIGLGNMGGILAERLLGAGFGAVAHDVDPNALRRVERLGAEPATSPRVVADRAELVVLSLPDAGVSEQVVHGTDGLVGGARLTTVVETSTIGWRAAERLAGALAAAGVDFGDAPVAGAMTAARRGELVTMVDGPSAAMERFRPLAESYCRSIHYLGPTPGTGQICKVVNNAITIANIPTVLEALRVGAAAGIDPPLLLEIIGQGSGRSFVTEDYLPDYVAAGHALGSVAVMAKDAALFLDAASDVGTDAPLSAEVRTMWERLAAANPSGLDVSEVVRGVVGGRATREPATRHDRPRDRGRP